MSSMSEESTLASTEIFRGRFHRNRSADSGDYHAPILSRARARDMCGIDRRAIISEPIIGWSL